jgi:hypothetical protein
MHDTLLSVVLTTDKIPGQTTALLENLSLFLGARFKNYEIILVNDDHDLAADLSAQIKITRNLRVLTLARHYGHAVATLAGLQHAIGDHTVILGHQTDITIIDQLYNALHNDVDVVFAVSENKNNWQSHLLTKLAQLSQLPLADSQMQSALFRRRGLNSILTLRDEATHIPMLAAYQGLRSATITTNNLQQNSWRTTLRQIESIFVYSRWPMLILASLVFGIAILATVISLLSWIFAGLFDWQSLAQLLAMVAVTGLSGLMVMLAALLGRILRETKRQPLYSVSREESSRKVEIETIVQRK